MLHRRRYYIYQLKGINTKNIKLFTLKSKFNKEFQANTDTTVFRMINVINRPRMNNMTISNHEWTYKLPHSKTLIDISSYFLTMLVHNLKKSLTTKPSPFKYGRKPAFIQIILHISQIKRLLRFDSIGCWWMKSTSENVRLTWLVRLMGLLSEDVYYFTWLKTQYADHFYIHFPIPCTACLLQRTAWCIY